MRELLTTCTSMPALSRRENIAEIALDWTCSSSFAELPRSQHKILPKISQRKVWAHLEHICVARAVGR